MRAYGKSGVYGGSIIYSNEKDVDKRFEFGFNALVAGANAILTLGGVDIVNYKYEKTLIDKCKLWPQ